MSFAIIGLGVVSSSDALFLLTPDTHESIVEEANAAGFGPREGMPMTTVFNRGSGNWNTTGTWTPAVVPSNADNVVLNFFRFSHPNADYHVSLDGTGAALNLTVGNHNSLAISGGAFGGTLTVGDALVITNGGTLSGIGKIFAHSINNAGTIEGTEFFPLTINSDTPVINTGQLLANVGSLTVTGSLDNFGTVHASKTMTLASVSNSGDVISTGFGAKVIIQETLDNSGLAEAINNGSDILVHGTTTNSGTVLAKGDFFTSTIEFFASVTNSGRMQANHNGELNFDAGVVNKSGGQLIDNGGTIKVDGAATGGAALIEGSGTVVFNGSASVDTTTSVQFQGGGKFALSHSGNYTGSVSGFGISDSIDVKDVGFVPGKDSYNPGTDILTISNGTHMTKVQLVGVYTANDFTFGSDGHGGTLISWHGHAIV